MNPKNKTAVILGYIRKKNEPILIDCIKSLKEQTYKDFDIYIYDNSTEEDSLTDLKNAFPEVIIQKNAKNLGFAGGNNSVLRKIIEPGQYEYAVLLNDDTKPDKNWLNNLIKTAESDQKIGAVTSKLLFFKPYVRLNFSTETINPRKLGAGDDDRDLGVKFYESNAFAETDYSKKFFRDGFYGFETDEDKKFTWTRDSFTIDLPVEEDSADKFAVLQLHIKTNGFKEEQKVEVTLGEFKHTLTISKDTSQYEVKIPRDIINKQKFNLIQNAGSGITAQFNGYDIGNIQREGTISSDAEIDEDQYDERREVEMMCGGAVLLKVEALKKVGIFDEYLFTYYEDSDLSLRLKRAGWKIVYEPSAVVRHMHATSSVENSPFFIYHIRKNKPAFVLKNFGIRPSLYAIKELYVITCKSILEAVKLGFKNSWTNQVALINLKATFVFTLNMPLLLLKKFNILKSR